VNRPILLADDLVERIHDAEEAARDCHLATDALRAAESWRDDGEFQRSLRVSKGFIEGGQPWNHLVVETVRRDHAIRRSDVFEVASRLPSGALDEQQAAELLVNVNAWGYNRTGYGAWRTKELLAQPGFPRSATRALDILRTAGPAVAYYFLYNSAKDGSRDEGHVQGWGPAFFTKFLYFADPENQPRAVRSRPTALILDVYMARAVNRTAPSKPLGHFRDNGWTTPQYAFYITLLDRLATEQRSSDNALTPGIVEAILFRQELKISGNGGSRGG